MCIAIVCTKNSIFLFDSHSRDERGLPTSDGFSILMKFNGKGDLENHLSSVYLQNGDIDIHYETQNISLTKDNEHTDSSNDHQKNRSNCILAFEKAIENRPYYICVVCNRCLYKTTVKKFFSFLYNANMHHVFTDIQSFDANFYICHTCDRSLLKNKVPCQAVCNKLDVVPLAPEISSLRHLEKVLISKRILFKRISIMPKGQQPKIKGAICNVPICVDTLSNILPHGIDSSGLIFVKLKRKLSFKGHVIFESVSPDKIKCALEYLRACNPFYSNILIKMENISRDLLSVLDGECESESNTVDVEDLNLE